MFVRNRRLEELIKKVELIYTAIVVRDPGTAMASDAYDGLRKQVVASANERAAHLVHLAQLHSLVEAGAALSDVQALATEWLTQAGIRCVQEVEDEGLFDIAEGKDDGALVVSAPAYVDERSGRVIRKGRAMRGASDGAGGQV